MPEISPGHAGDSAGAGCTWRRVRGRRGGQSIGWSS